jgi:hypothetical protein
MNFVELSQYYKCKYYVNLFPTKKKKTKSHFGNCQLEKIFQHFSEPFIFQQETLTKKQKALLGIITFLSSEQRFVTFLEYSEGSQQCRVEPKIKNF